jgi:thioredoxin-related protein
MTRSILAPALALLLAAPALAQNDASVIPEDAPDWLTMEEAVADVQAGDRLLLVYGYAAWCGYCVRFDREVFTDDAVQAYVNEHYAPVRLDLESAEEVPFFDATVTMAQLGAAMAISGTPTSVFVDGDGTLITKLPGYTDPETYLLALRYVREEAYETVAFEDFLEAERAAPADGASGQ